MTGTELTELIERLGMTREEFAAELFTTVSNVKEWEQTREGEIKNRLIANAVEGLEERIKRVDREPTNFSRSDENW